MSLVRGALGNPVGAGSTPAQPDPGPLRDTQLVDPPANDPTATDEDSASERVISDGLAKYIRDAYEAARDWRQQSGVDEDLLGALRAVRGEYAPEKKSAIKQMGGSDVYLRISANKVRSVAAAMRDVYTSQARPWGIGATSEPEMPTDPATEALIQSILQTEIQEAAMNGAGSALTPQMVFDRRRALRDLMYQHTMQNATEAMRLREDNMDDILQQGGFYQALWDFLLDIPTFSFAVLKGPVVYYRNQLHWEQGKPVVKSEPTMTWERCSPFDVYFAPWSQKAQDGYIVHKQRATRASLQALIGLPSYNTDAIMEVLERDSDAMKDWFSYVEQDRSVMERRAPDDNNSLRTDAVDRPFPMLEFHGPVSGQLLMEWGVPKNKVPDASKDLDITAWLIDDKVIGVRLNPHPMGNKPFYVDSFERVPGSIYGLGVPKMIEDIQDGGGATLRALVNNMAIASGPQVAVNEGRMASSETQITMYPWKIWSTTDDPTGSGNAKPVDFFQPQSNAGELLGVLKAFMDMADTFSTMPQYMQGNAQGVSTIGRTSSGLAMLMDAASRTMKQSVTSIDNNVIKPAVTDLNIFLALMRPDIVDDGDINIVAKGATELVQREQLRMRRADFLQVTSNPIDAQIIGPAGRAEIIKEIARDLQLPVDKIITGVPNGAAMPPPGGAPGGPPSPNGPPGGAMQGAAPPPPGQQASQPASMGGTNPTAGMAAPAKV
jgi:hypothetical protein